MIPDFKTYIKESIWGDLARRSGGTQFRAEDDINNLDIEEFVQYLKDSYEVCIPGPNFFNINYWVSSGTYKGNISIPIEQNNYNDTPNLSDRMLTIRKNLETNEYLSIEPNKYFFRLYPRELKKTFGDKYEVDTKFGQDGQLIPKDGKITNQVCVDVIDKLLCMVERPILKKKS